MIPAHDLLAKRIRVELAELERSVARSRRAWEAAVRTTGDQDMYIDSAALNLHGLYSGLERLFEYIANQMDGGVPKGEAWHRELVRQMTMEVEGFRPPVIGGETAEALDEFRRFRHVVRNVYAEHLDAARIGRLVGKLSDVWPRLKADLTAFAEFLEALSRADETGVE